MLNPNSHLPAHSSLARYMGHVLTASLTVLLSGMAASTLRADEAAKGSHKEPPSLTLLGNETRSLLRQEAVLKDKPGKKAAATALCDMYVILRLDSRYSNSKMLQGDATRIRRRLITIAKKKQNELERAGVDRPADLSSNVASSIAAAMSNYKNKAAGKNGGLGNDDAAGKNGGLGNDDAAGNQADRGDRGLGGNKNTHGDSSRDNDTTTGQNPGAGHIQRGGQAAGGIPDTGWELVELIQRIIDPDFWDSRGGPGSIRYFAMRKVLVVRATTDVHEQVRDLLMALR